MASVAHEGNPRVNSLVVAGTLDGDIFLLPLVGDSGVPQAGPAEPDIEPVINDECPDCEPFEFSKFDQDAFDLCHSDEGDGVATVEGDCAFMGEPECTNYCTDYYGDFRIGINCNGEGGQEDQPFYWESQPLWICPSGTVTCNSACAPAVTSQAIRFDTAFFESSLESPEHYVSLTPETALTTLESEQSRSAGQDGKNVFQLAVCDVDVECTTGAECAEEPLNNGMGLDFSCRYVSEENKGIIALALLNDDGTNLTITGYGILLDRDQGIAAVVSWNGAAHEDYTVLSSGAYTPVEDDPMRINMTLTCDDDDGSEDFESLTIIPNFGRIKGSCGFSGPGQFSFTSDQGVVTRAQFENITHCALIVLPNFNNQECRNTITIRRVAAIFQRETE